MRWYFSVKNIACAFFVAAVPAVMGAQPDLGSVQGTARCSMQRWATADGSERVLTWDRGRAVYAIRENRQAQRTLVMTYITTPSGGIAVSLWSPEYEVEFTVTAETRSACGQANPLTLSLRQAGHTTEASVVRSPLATLELVSSAINGSSLPALFMGSAVAADVVRLIEDLSTLHLGQLSVATHTLVVANAALGLGAQPSRSYLIPEEGANALKQGPLGEYYDCLQSACETDCGGTWFPNSLFQCGCAGSLACAICYELSIYPCLFRLVPIGG